MKSRIHIQIRVDLKWVWFAGQRILGITQQRETKAYLFRLA